jgi:hypothetical protein
LKGLEDSGRTQITRARVVVFIILDSYFCLRKKNDGLVASEEPVFVKKSETHPKTPTRPNLGIMVIMSGRGT